MFFHHFIQFFFSIFLFQPKIFCSFFQKTFFYFFSNTFLDLINQKYFLKVQRYCYSLFNFYFNKSSLFYILIYHLIFNDLYNFNYLKFYYISKLISLLHCRFLKKYYYPYFLHIFLFILKLVYLFFSFILLFQNFL